MIEQQVFKIPSGELAKLYTTMKCDGCGKLLTAEPSETWAKAGCGYFCAECLSKHIHTSHPACTKR